MAVTQLSGSRPLPFWSLPRCHDSVSLSGFFTIPDNVNHAFEVFESWSEEIADTNDALPVSI
jgi:hypothetical protein